MDLATFLESHPPGSSAFISDEKVSIRSAGNHHFELPELQLHCANAPCAGPRFFKPNDEHLGPLSRSVLNATYQCRNCGGSTKVYALIYVVSANLLHKLGELPTFGPPLPSRLITMVGPDRELFLRGRRAENIGLGVGAFAYYRRVVEAQWHRLVDQIVKVAEATNASAPMIEVLKKANSETQFKKAVELIKDGIPDSLKMGGQNPLTLLYAALSQGIHDLDDASCLELAGSVRVVLAELAERVGLALKDERELQDAVARLKKANATPK